MGVSFKRGLLLNSFYCLIFINKSLWLNNLKTRTAMNAKMSVFVMFVSVSLFVVEAIIYFLLYNLHDCTFMYNKMLL